MSVTRPPPIKPVGYPPNAISALPSPSIRNPTSLVYHSYFGVGVQEGAQQEHSEVLVDTQWVFDNVSQSSPTNLFTQTLQRDNDIVL